ncbi:MAG: hypothetical protein ACKO1J_10335 [Tagaea sp.]
MDETFEPGDRLLAIAGGSVRHAIATGAGMCVFSGARGEIRQAKVRDWVGAAEIAYRLEPWSRHRGADAAARALARVGTRNPDFADGSGSAFADWCFTGELPAPAAEPWTRRLARAFTPWPETRAART